MNDPVNHPSHYKMSNGVEVIQLTENLNFCRGNAVKYICRAGEKDPAKEIEDLRKAAWYINREIERTEREHDSVAVNEALKAPLIQQINDYCQTQDGCDTCPVHNLGLCSISWRSLSVGKLEELIDCISEQNGGGHD